MNIDPNLINNKSDFELIKNQSICSLCNYIIWEPFQCSVCQSAFCYNCINEYYLQNGNSCPNKCENPSFKSSKLVKDILSTLIFNCPNNCDILIPYQEYFTHSRSKCTKIDYKKKYFELKEKLEKLKEEYFLWVPKIPVSIKDSAFKSKYHYHPLVYLETVERGRWYCSFCEESHKEGDKSYYCTLCDYDLCDKCKSSEEKQAKLNTEKNK